MDTQIGIQPTVDLAGYADVQERRAGRLDVRALRAAIGLPRAGAGQGAEDLALWYIPFLAATLLSLLAVAALAIGAQL